MVAEKTFFNVCVYKQMFDTTLSLFFWEDVFAQELQQLQSKGPACELKLAIVVEVDFSCKPHHLQELLLSIKDMGYERNLAHFMAITHFVE